MEYERSGDTGSELPEQRPSEDIARLQDLAEVAASAAVSPADAQAAALASSPDHETVSMSADTRFADNGDVDDGTMFVVDSSTAGGGAPHEAHEKQDSCDDQEAAPDTPVATGGSGTRPPSDLPPPGGADGDRSPEPEDSDDIGAEGGDGAPTVETTDNVFSEVKRSFVGDLVTRVIEEVDPKTDALFGIFVIELVAAKAAVGAEDEIHDCAAQVIGKLDLEAAEAVTAWAGAYAAGDEAALPIARELAGVEVAEDGTLQRQNKSAPSDQETEAIAKLAAHGDTEAIPLARETIAESTDPTKDALSLLLYMHGDEASLDTALAGIQTLPPAEPGHPHSGRKRQALLNHARKATIGMEDITGALKVREIMPASIARAKLDVCIFQLGHEESRTRVYEAIMAYRETDPVSVQALERGLAIGGDPHAIDHLRARVEWNRQAPPDEARRVMVLDDLCALHLSGDPTAAEDIKAMIQADDYGINRWAVQLIAGGKPQLALTILEELPREKVSPASYGLMQACRLQVDPNDMFALNNYLTAVFQAEKRDMQSAARAVHAFANS